MVDATIVNAIKHPLDSLPHYGMHVSKAMLHGSVALGVRNSWSDIDWIRVAPEFGGALGMLTIENLWSATEAIDDCIEPIPCGAREWMDNKGRPIFPIACWKGIGIVD